MACSESAGYPEGECSEEMPKLDIDASRQPNFGRDHRSGWAYALRALQGLHVPGGVLLDSFIERTFGWSRRDESARGRIPYDRPWVGFLHNPPGVPIWHDYEHSPVNIVRGSLFQESLATCAGLFCLSDYARQWLQTCVHVPVVNLIHPTEATEVRFSIDAYCRNTMRRVVHVGWWLRRLKSIYELPVKSLRKTVLLPLNPWFEHVLKREERILGYNHACFPEVEHVRFLSNDAYDCLLSKNIAFCHLFDSSANNAVIECIVRTTPVLVNPLPAVVEYLGRDYPFYFNDLEEAAAKAEDMGCVEAAHAYLQNLPKDSLTAESFRRSFVRSSIYAGLPAPPPHAMPGSKGVPR